MSLVHRWGSPLREVDRASVNVNDTEIFDGQWGELWFTLGFEPREPTQKEWESSVSEFVRQFHIQNPDLEARYLEASRGSPYRICIQFISHGNPIVWAVIGTAIAALLAFIFKNFVAILATMILLAIGYALYKYVGPTVYECPICGAKFSTYEALVAHMEYEHPGAPIPKKAPLISEEILRAGIIVGTLGIGALLIYKLATRKP